MGMLDPPIRPTGKYGAASRLSGGGHGSACQPISGPHGHAPHAIVGATVFPPTYTGIDLGSLIGATGTSSTTATITADSPALSSFSEIPLGGNATRSTSIGKMDPPVRPTVIPHEGAPHEQAVATTSAGMIDETVLPSGALSGDAPYGNAPYGIMAVRTTAEVMDEPTRPTWLGPEEAPPEFATTRATAEMVDGFFRPTG